MVSKAVSNRESLVSPVPEEATGLSQLGATLSKFLEGGAAPRLAGPDGETVPLPASVLRVLTQAVQAMSRGQTVTLVALGRSLTTQQAAEILQVSRPHLIKLLESGEIAFDKVGTHRRVAIEDLLAFQDRRDTERREALRAMTELGQELGG